MFENKKIFILGMARSGYEAAKILISKGNEVYLNDMKEESKQDSNQVDELRKLGVKLFFGSHPDDLFDDSFDYLIKNPGIPIAHKYVLKARELGIEVINEVEMCYRLLPSDVTLIAITGTNGKTTTTTLTYNILKSYYPDKTILAGNIGYPLSSVIEKVKSGDILVMEISAQQGENLVNFKPNIAVLTNFFPAHIEFFKSYEYYKSVKSKIFFNQTEDDVSIVNLDNKDANDEIKGIKSNIKYFSSSNQINGIYLKDDFIYYYDEKIISKNDIKIKGVHNIENCMCAIGVAKELGVPNEVISKTISEFKGVEHRLEYVDEIDGRVFYNDTEATNIKSTQIALASFEQPTLIVLGGLERNQVLEELTPFMKNVKAVLAIGQCRERVKKYVESLNIKCLCYEYMKDGFKDLYSLSSAGDVILLSPATASWDQYKECEERGAEFKKLVSELK
jgi:UDP-N-acetylmuramoylalanine--D-glutamate ligase